MSLEASSGAKTLLKLLLDKTNDVLTQSQTNKELQTEWVKLRPFHMRDWSETLKVNIQEFKG